MADAKKFTDENFDGLALPGVTAFLKEGVPDVALRAAYSKFSKETLLDVLQKLGLGGKHLEAAEKFADKFPRVVAHSFFHEMTPSTTAAANLAGEGKLMGVQTQAKLPGSLGKMSNIELAKNRMPEKVLDALFHETGHAAQQISKGDRFDDLYNAADDAFGYVNNPYERGARAVSMNKMKSIGAPASGQTFLDVLAKLIGLQ